MSPKTYPVRVQNIRLAITGSSIIVPVSVVGKFVLANVHLAWHREEVKYRILLFLLINLSKGLHYTGRLLYDFTFDSAFLSQRKRVITLVVAFTLQQLLFSFIMLLLFFRFFANSGDHSQHKDGQQLVQRIHETSLNPLWYRCTGMGES